VSAYIIYLLTLWAIVSISALALNLTFGWGGLINLGHMGFVALGAYTSAVLTTEHHVAIGLGILAGVAVAAVAAAIVASITRTLQGDPLAIILFGFNFTVYAITINWSVTRASLGIPGIPRPAWFATDMRFFLLTLAVLAVVTAGFAFVVRSPFGLALGAIRDDELHARVLGKRTFHVKLVTFVLSGALAGLAGALEAHFIRFINPQGFFLPQLVLVLSAIFVGGLASVRGSLVGAAVVTFLPEVVRNLFNLPDASIGAIRGMLFSVMLVLVVLYRPKGIFGKVELPFSYADRD